MQEKTKYIIFLMPQIIFYIGMFSIWYPYREPGDPTFWLVLGLVGFGLFYILGSAIDEFTRG